MKKTPLQSTTIQGGVISLLVGLSMLLELDFGAEYISTVVQAVGLIIGAVMTVYGRIKAKSEIET